MSHDYNDEIALKIISYLLVWFLAASINTVKLIRGLASFKNGCCKKLKKFNYTSKHKKIVLFKFIKNI